ncbi:co-chaperone protein DjlA-like [Ylistrum balloti]|uniref:co-chaperone protein DjlA-like n=1 Tax=Ylistrum balloti TaxID=509963 RepID=UPI002905F3FA|nr:co-chaperone protein DjlA-like [Ylistrum balloti]
MFKRILGAGLGWSLGGPIGGLIGWWLAGKLDQSSQPRVGRQQTTHSDFIFSMLILASKVMKADNRITVKEIEYVKEFLLQHFQIEEVQEMMMFLRDIEKKEYSLEEVCDQINQCMLTEEKNQLLHFLFGLSNSDGQSHSLEIDILSRIAVLLKIPSHVFHSMRNLYGNQEHDIVHYYRVLDIPQSASNEEIKKAFREISLQNHPDKVAHLGENIRKSAEEKFKIINEAYQKIKKSRGF